MSPSEAELSAFFQDVILEHYRRPRNKRVLPDADAVGSVSNPLCGDEATVYLSFDGDRVSTATFTGQGCSIAQASALMMTQAVEGLAVEEAQALHSRLGNLLEGGEAHAASDDLGELFVLGAVAKFPARIRCALLPWEALAVGLQNARLAARPPGSSLSELADSG